MPSRVELTDCPELLEVTDSAWVQDGDHGPRIRRVLAWLAAVAAIVVLAGYLQLSPDVTPAPTTTAPDESVPAVRLATSQLVVVPGRRGHPTVARLELVNTGRSPLVLRRVTTDSAPVAETLLDLPHGGGVLTLPAVLDHGVAVEARVVFRAAVPFTSMSRVVLHVTEQSTGASETVVAPGAAVVSLH